MLLLVMLLLFASASPCHRAAAGASWPPCAGSGGGSGGGAGGLTITNVHLVMMNHLDVGFSTDNSSAPHQEGFINNVLNEYFASYFPRAVRVAAELRARGGTERLVYTTHGWLAHLYVHCPADFVLSGIPLRCPSRAEVSAFKVAARQGDIVWHAGAFNTEYELAFNAEMVAEQFRLSRELSDELGVERSRTLSLRDVPGTTRALIPLLVHNNISALTVGVNNGSPDPSMPSPGRWVDPASNTSVIFMQTGPGVGYPAREANHGGLCRRVCVTATKLAHAMCWAFRPDNSGPPLNVDEVVSYFDAARAAFPGAVVEASTYDRFVRQLTAVAHELPTAAGEVGDTWVTSQTADPNKWIFYREASRAYSECRVAGLCDPANDPRVAGFLRCLITLPEHTGGPDTFVGSNNWTNAHFHKDIAAGYPGFITAKRAYLEQREIGSVLGMHYLGDHPLSRNISDRLEALRPAVPETSTLAQLPRSEWSTPLTVHTSAGEVSLGLDPATGAFTTVMMAGFNYAGRRNPIGQYIYRTFNDTDYRKQQGYCCYGLPGRQHSANPNQTFTSPHVTGVWREKSASPRSLTARLEMPHVQHQNYGAPQVLWLRATIEADGTVSLDLQAFHKTSTRLGEASFIRFRPVERDDCRWFMDKLGSWIDPLDTVTNGSMHSHGIRNGVAYFNSSSGKAVLAIDSLDAFIADPATVADPATNFLMPLTPLTGPIIGFDMQLHQNAFSTNMPLFSLDADFRWRFRIRAEPPDTAKPAKHQEEYKSSTKHAPSIPPLHPIDDWHYPAEEAAEMQALLSSGLRVTKLHCESNVTGTLTMRVANGSSATVHVPGDKVLGWTLRGFLTPGTGLAPDQWSVRSQIGTAAAAMGCLAIADFEAPRWGFTVFLGPDFQLGPSGVVNGYGLRKGVGRISALLRPKLDPRLSSSNYYAQAVADPRDALSSAMENESVFAETTFSAAAAYLPPTHDYGLVGNPQSHTKFSIAQDGKIHLANFSIFSPIDQGPNVTGGKQPGVLLFNPQNYLSWWPPTGIFSDYKTSILGRYTRAVALAAWDSAAQRGFSLTAVPNTQRGVATQPYDTAELLVRVIEQYNKKADGVPQYFAVRGCVIVGSSVDQQAVNGTSGDQLCRTPVQCQPAVRCTNPSHTATARLHDVGALFHANLLAHATSWSSLFEGDLSTASGGLQIELRYDLSEGSRLVDMGRATIASAMSTFVRERPNYGDGSNYWSVAAADRGALPLESFSLNHALILWGLTKPAAARVEYYLDHYVRGANGMTPQNSTGTNSSTGFPGSIDLKHWRDACVFADSFADLGRWVELWVDVARAQEAAQDVEGRKWILRTWPQVKLMAQYIYKLRINATHTVGIAKGLIYGPAEFDECLYQQHWFSISAYAWRGLLQLQRFLIDTAVLTGEGTYAATLLDECSAFKRDLDAARDAALVRDENGDPFFIPPYAVANFTPYTAMPYSNRGTPQQDYGGGGAYANFRYFSEMLSAQFMGPQIDVALSEFRESHFGTLSSMTRFRTHLDDMPAAGYAYSAVATNRTRSYNSLLFGHIANYQSHGTFNAPEQLGFHIGDDGYRALMGPGTSETDIDTCVPSTTLVAMMLRWMLVFESRDADTVWLLKAAPRRFYSGNGTLSPNFGGFLSVRRAATRFGWVSFTLGYVDVRQTKNQDASISSSLHIQTNISLVLHGRGFVSTPNHLKVVLRLRDPTGERSLRSAVIRSITGGQVTLSEVDSVGECVVAEVPKSGVQRSTDGTVSFTVVAHFV
jgi:hypothetical protein